MKKNNKEHRNIDMYKAILTLETLDECISFFDDLCSMSEIKAMEQRFEVADLLNQGFIYSEILEKTGASSATISRVNRSLQYGANGYSVVFDRMKQMGKESEDEKTENKI